MGLGRERQIFFEIIDTSQSAEPGSVALQSWLLLKQSFSTHLRAE